MSNTRIKKFRARRPKQPKVIPPPKPPRPRISKLRKIYHDLISSSVDQRVETLKKAAHWYEEAIAYVSYFQAWNLSQKRALVRAHSCRLIVLRSDKDTTKEEKLIEAIRAYESVIRKLRPPKINLYLSKYSKLRSVLEKRKRKFNKKFGMFIDTVDSVFKPVNYAGIRIKLYVDKLSNKYRISSEGNITFDRKFLDAARREARKKGFLVGSLLILPALAEAAGMTMERDSAGHRTGRYRISNTHRVKAWEDMMNNLAQRCLTDKSIRLVRRQKVTTPSVD